MSASVASDPQPASISSAEAPLTLAEPPPQTLGPRDTFGLWANLGVSLLLPVAAAFVVLPGRSLWVSIAAVVVGAVIGSVLLGLTAAPSARERVPAMVLLRGLLGRRASYVPTALNVVQCVGWATFEIVIIADAASRAVSAPRWPFVVVAGLLATAMAVRPLGAMRVLGRYAIWASLAATVYLFVRVLGHPLHVPSQGAASFWSAVDVVIALPVSWFPLAGDYTRHSRTARTAFVGAAAGYGISTVAFFVLGVLALAAYGTGGLDVIGALLAVPVGVLAVLVLVALELDEAFANIYSTAVSAQNVVARVDRRLLAVAVGVVATVLALVIDVASYEAFLYLIGAVFVPLAGVLVVAYHLVPRGAWDVSDTAPARLWLIVPWVAGFIGYQLTLPTYFDGAGAGWTAWWTARQADVGIPAGNGWSASLVSLAVAALLTAAVTLPASLRSRRRDRRAERG
jgi:putative hydroxymethylpyrimidine transporter CytX